MQGKLSRFSTGSLTFVWMQSPPETLSCMTEAIRILRFAIAGLLHLHNRRGWTFQLLEAVNVRSAGHICWTCLSWIIGFFENGNGNFYDGGSFLRPSFHSLALSILIDTNLVIRCCLAVFRVLPMLEQDRQRCSLQRLSSTSY